MRSWSEERVMWELAAPFNIAPADILFMSSAGAWVGGNTNATWTGWEVVALARTGSLYIMRQVKMSP